MARRFALGQPAVSRAKTFLPLDWKACGPPIQFLSGGFAAALALSQEPHHLEYVPLPRGASSDVRPVIRKSAPRRGAFGARCFGCHEGFAEFHSGFRTERTRYCNERRSGGGDSIYQPHLLRADHSFMIIRTPSNWRPFPSLGRSWRSTGRVRQRSARGPIGQPDVLQAAITIDRARSCDQMSSPRALVPDRALRTPRHSGCETGVCKPQSRLAETRIARSVLRPKGSIRCRPPTLRAMISAARG